MTACPICQKPVDPLRARFVRVRDGKVVAYCSPECATKSDGMKSGPVITSAAVPTPAPVPVTAPVTAPVAQVRAVTPATGTPKVIAADLASGPVIEIRYEPASGVVTSARDEREVDAKPAEPARTRPGDTNEVDPVEIVESADAGGDEPPRRRRDSLDIRRAEPWLEEEPADLRPETAPVEVERAGGRRGLWLVIALVVLAGGGFAIYKLATGSDAAPPAPPPAPAVSMPAPPDAPPPITPAQALERAQQVLEMYMSTPESSRVALPAAAALARVRHKGALDRLAAGLDEKDLGDARKLDVAYALARAGDPRGLNVLVAGLGASNRDHKLVAARYLAQLGDKRGADMLGNFLEINQNRVEAARDLVRVKHPAAIQLFDKIRSDPQAMPESKKIAIIALAPVKAEVVPEVRALLADSRFNLEAADALAELHDEAARPTLTAQVENIGIRVRAARALRRLDPNANLAPVIARLATALDDPSRDKDTERIPVAEAILLLAGDPSWSDRP